jgi:Inner membrane component of T3SS, cytoplasmic domain/Inner membrane component of T3SS, periplasmic domain
MSSIPVTTDIAKVNGFSTETSSSNPAVAHRTGLKKDTSGKTAGMSKYRALRVLTGMHTGAESVLQAERLLVGNMEGECDITLNVGYAEPHACLVRLSDDSWTVLSISGDLWVNDTHVELQRTMDLVPGAVLTLGRVGFAIADSETFDWAPVKPPFSLIKPDPTGPMPSVALLPAVQERRRKWHALKLAVGVGISSLVMASAGAYVAQVLNNRIPTAEAAEKKLQSDKQMIAALPSGKEVSLAPFPEAPGRVLVQGYVAKRSQIAELSSALKKAETDAEIRLIPIDDLSKELVRRFDRVTADRVRYDAQGRFVVTTRSEDLPSHDKQARVLLQEVPAVAGVELSMSDLQTAEGQPVVVKYLRSAEHPSDVAVSNLDSALGRRPFTVRELRMGELPSVVLDDGMRYFTGAKLPDGSSVKSIAEDRMVVIRAQGVESSVSLKDAPRTAAAVAEGQIKPQQSAFAQDTKNTRK